MQLSRLSVKAPYLCPAAGRMERKQLSPSHDALGRLWRSHQTLSGPAWLKENPDIHHVSGNKDLGGGHKGGGKKKVGCARAFKAAAQLQQLIGALKPIYHRGDKVKESRVY